MLFFSQLGKLDRYIGVTHSRKILLFNGNCFAQGSKEMLPVLKNTDKYFLPPNTTSRLQPLDADIASQLKGEFRRLHFPVFKNIEAGKTSIYNIDFLTALRSVIEEWNTWSPEFIQKCFMHCCEEQKCENTFNNATALQEQVVRDLNEQGVPYTRVRIENLLEPEEEDEVTEAITLDNQVPYIAGRASDDFAGSEDEGDAYSIAEELKAFARATEALQRHGRRFTVYARSAVRACIGSFR